LQFKIITELNVRQRTGTPSKTVEENLWELKPNKEISGLTPITRSIEEKIDEEVSY
jgi:hypothetical protein